jgi:hypothetical protein
MAVSRLWREIMLQMLSQNAAFHGSFMVASSSCWRTRDAIYYLCK